MGIDRGNDDWNLGGANVAHPRPPTATSTRYRRLDQFVPYLGYFAGALTVVSYAPQAIRVWRTKKTDDLSFPMFVMLVSASIAWIAYGVLSKAPPVIATNVGTLALNLVILGAKIRYR